MAELKITNLCKKYEDDFEAVRDFNLEARDGEFIVIALRLWQVNNAANDCGTGTAVGRKYFAGRHGD